jgi:hypothetical protein
VEVNSTSNLEVLFKEVQRKLYESFRPIFLFTDIKISHSLDFKVTKFNLKISFEIHTLLAKTARNRYARRYARTWHFTSTFLNKLSSQEEFISFFVEKISNFIFKCEFGIHYKYITQVLRYILSIQKDSTLRQESNLNFEGKLLFYNLKLVENQHSEPFVVGLIANNRSPTYNINNERFNGTVLKSFTCWVHTLNIRIQDTQPRNFPKLFYWWSTSNSRYRLNKQLNMRKFN